MVEDLPIRLSGGQGSSQEVLHGEAMMDQVFGKYGVIHYRILLNDDLMSNFFSPV